MQAAFLRFGDAVERGLHIGHATGDDDLHRVAVEARGRYAARARIVEQAIGFVGTGQTHGRFLTGFTIGERR